MKIVADNTIPYLKGVLEPFAEVDYLPARHFTNDAIRDADALIVRSIDKCDAALLTGNSVKLITTATIGYDHIDTLFCREKGIAWKNAPGSNARSVGEYVLNSLIYLSLQRQVSLKDKTIGIIGVGHVGQWVEKLCKGYGMDVLLNDPPRAEQEGNKGFVSLETITRECDIITIHTPLTKEGTYPTFHLANDSFFRSLQKKPWFINAARGSVHDTAALLRAKQEGLIGELLLDCWENEPHINRELMKQSAIATPHIAGFSADGKANATRMCVENIRDFFSLPMGSLDHIKPEAPQHPTIDRQKFQQQCLEDILLACSNPDATSQQLKANPEQFEQIRNCYNNPREFPAYTISHAGKEELNAFKRLGFRIGN